MKIVGMGLVMAAVACVNAQQGKVLGFYGQALEDTSVYAMPSAKSKVYYRAKQYKYMIVSRYSERYTKVLMSDGRYGYAKADKVAILPQQVYQKVAQRSGTDNTSRGTAKTRAAAAAKGTLYKGTPYVWGGNDINNGIDCSAFVKKLYGDIGIALPRTAAEQAQVGQKITRLEELQAGDRLYFWEKKRNTIGHTGLYLGNGYFVHSSRGRNGVDTSYLSENWLRILVAARR